MRAAPNIQRYVSVLRFECPLLLLDAPLAIVIRALEVPSHHPELHMDIIAKSS